MNRAKKLMMISLFVFMITSFQANAGISKLFRLIGNVTKTAAGVYVTRISFEQLMNYHKVHLGARGVIQDVNDATDGFVDVIKDMFPKVSADVNKEIYMQYAQKGAFLFAGPYATYAGINGILKELTTEPKRTHKRNTAI